MFSDKLYSLRRHLESLYIQFKANYFKFVGKR